MARPKSNKPKRQQQLRIMFTPEERDWLEHYCDSTGQTMSELMRSLLREFRHTHPQYELELRTRSVVANVEIGSKFDSE
ncbi:MAG: hypothetical protein AB1489_43755 [Acidobacteriota bacterium]